MVVVSDGSKTMEDMPMGRLGPAGEILRMVRERERHYYVTCTHNTAGPIFGTDKIEEWE